MILPVNTAGVFYTLDTVQQQHMERRAGETKVEDGEAVSPVIGVVLMVAITVIVATVVSAFALTLAEDRTEKHIQAAVTIDVDESNEEITFHVTSMGNAEYIVVRGPLHQNLTGSTFEPFLNKTGQQITLNKSKHLRDKGHVSAVAIRGDMQYVKHYYGVPTAMVVPIKAQTQVNRKDYDFT